MLRVENISFAYPGGMVFENVSFAVAPGETVALVGPNGAGKTTLLRVLAGILLPSSGSVRASGFDALAMPLRFRRTLGYLSERAPVESGVTVREYLKFRAALKGEQARRIRHRVGEALAACGLENVADMPTERLSQGLRKRVALAEAILLRPRILLLDDVFAGLDPAARAAVVKTLSGATPFSACVVAGHERTELAAVAKRFLLLQRGVLREVSPDEAGKVLVK